MYDVGIIIGKGFFYGGSLVCIEVIGYGFVYFIVEMLEVVGEIICGKKIVVFGLGNVVIYVIEKVYELGVKVVVCSDFVGFVYDKEGIKVEIVK